MYHRLHLYYLHMEEKLDIEIIELIVKFLNNQCTKSEIEKVLGIIESGSHQHEWEFVLTEEASALVNSPEPAEIPAFESVSLHKRIQETLSKTKGKTVILTRTYSYWKKIAAAAILLITFSVGAFYYFPKKPISAYIAHDIPPGGNRAILTLANGKKLILSQEKNGELANQSDVVITKLADGRIIYKVKPGTGINTASNTIETPKGGQYEVILPDGTSVLLNSASQLIFPTSFKDAGERRVRLKGEAFFKVAKMASKNGGKRGAGSIPFIVETERAEIEVLGTHFNINSYADEPVSKTTLIEGSVSVHAFGHIRILNPGYQAITGNGNLTVEEANIDESIAWKNGYFVFDSESIESIMRRVSRWYDIEVVYVGDIPKDKFGGTVSRFSNVSKVLSKLELTNKVHFKIEERRITVTK